MLHISEKVLTIVQHCGYGVNQLTNDKVITKIQNVNAKW